MRKHFSGAAALAAALAVLLALIFTFPLWRETPAGQGLAGLFESSGETTAPAGELLSVYFIDCGQGDAALLIFPGGQTMLIDAGGAAGTASVLAAIDRAGVSRLDYVVATHPHEDHIGALAAVLDRYPAGEIFMPDAVTASATFERLLDKIEEKNLEVSVPEAGEYLFGSAGSGLSALVLASGGFDDLNNCSIVLRIEYGEVALLFTGDAEKKSEDAQLASGLPLRADILKVGHHGSRTSSSAEYLRAAAPKYAVISCGADNSYGHPHKEVLSRLSGAGAEVFRTDRSGTVLAVTDGAAIEIGPAG